nr:homeobox-leucine zipper protein HOX11-like isoform X3 [Ipomoea batatas]
MELGLSVGGDSSNIPSLKPFSFLEISAYEDQKNIGRGKDNNIGFCMGALGDGGSEEEEEEAENTVDEEPPLQLALLPLSPPPLPCAARFPCLSHNCSDEIEDEIINGGLGRKKLRLTRQQSAFLEQTFKQHSTLNPKNKAALAKQLNLRPRQVEVWFQNRRARQKKHSKSCQFQSTRKHQCTHTESALWLETLDPTSPSSPVWASPSAPPFLHQLLHVALDRDPHEGVARVRQEADEPVRDVAAVEDLEDEAAPPHAELESRHRVLLPFGETGPPLYVEAHDQVVQTAAMDGLHLGDPVNDLSGLVGDQGSDNVSLELNVEQIGESVHVVNNANFHSYGGFEDFRGRERESEAVRRKEMDWSPNIEFQILNALEKGKPYSKLLNYWPRHN